MQLLKMLSASATPKSYMMFERVKDKTQKFFRKMDVEYKASSNVFCHFIIEHIKASSFDV